MPAGSTAPLWGTWPPSARALCTPLALPGAQVGRAEEVVVVVVGRAPLPPLTPGQSPPLRQGQQRQPPLPPRPTPPPPQRQRQRSRAGWAFWTGLPPAAGRVVAWRGTLQQALAAAVGGVRMLCQPWLPLGAQGHPPSAPPWAPCAPCRCPPKRNREKKGGALSVCVFTYDCYRDFLCYLHPASLVFSRISRWRPAPPPRRTRPSSPR